MKDSLALTLARDDDGTGELRAHVTSGLFSGQGSAWFNLDAIGEFAERLLSYPLPAQGVGPLEGGYWSKENPATLNEKHLSLVFHPLGSRGMIACKVYLRANEGGSEHPESYHAVDARLVFQYEELGRFAKALKGLVNGTTERAILKGNGA